MIEELPLLKESDDKLCHFKNRVKKNYRHLRKWAKRTQTNCFRIYDRDIKEFPVSIDYYAGRFCVHYFFTHHDEQDPPQALETKVTETLCALFDSPLLPIVWKHRYKRTKTEQYEKIARTDDYFSVYEYGVKFWVNLKDYLDTGLFLDHRETRQLVAKASDQKRLLNLFAYTSAFSVHAASKGARFTKSVDMSNTYLNWSEENFLLNGICLDNHLLIRADCLKFLPQETERYDVIVIDPPTVSRSKKMDTFFDIQKDYIPLIGEALKRLLPGGMIFFSTNSRQFSFDASLFPHTKIQDITQKTIPEDFHNQKIHKCWIIKPEEK
jgi:23S rRNA (cytosine1962-C5)-methyltransferase